MSEDVRVNVGSQVEPAPNCATKLETDAEVIVPPSGHTATMLAAGPTGVLLLAGGGVTTGVDDPPDATAGTMTGAGLLLQVTLYGLVCCCALSCLTTPGAGSKALSGGVV